MLYLKTHNLAFVHVPKNAGKSVDRALRSSGKLDFDDFARDCGVTAERAEHLMGDNVDDFLGLGPVKPIHLPLAYVESHLPRSWAALRQAHSFIFVRQPRARFFSALLQRLGEYADVQALRADDPRIVLEAQRVCAWLDGRGPFCDMQYIHFARQIDYAALRGARIISAIFPLDRTDLAERWVSEKTGLSLRIAHDHARKEPRKWAKGIQPAARFLGRTLLPDGLRKAIYPLWKNSGVFANASGRYGSVSLGAEVEQFITSYYAGDAILYAEACANAALADKTSAAA